MRGGSKEWDCIKMSARDSVFDLHVVLWLPLILGFASRSGRIQPARVAIPKSTARPNA